MKSNVNTEGLEVQHEILNALKNFKQARVLENSYFRAQHIVSQDMIMHSSEDLIEESVKRQMIQNIATELWNKFGNSIVKENHCGPFGQDLKYSVDALIMPMKDFKHAVEYIIRTMPQNAIDEIRK
jgi:hypothetical protein